MLLINHEIEFVSGDMHIFLVFLQVELFCLLQAHFHSRLTQVFDECFTLWHTLERTEECQLTCLTLLFIRTTHFGFCFGQQLGGQSILCTNQQLNAMLILIIHLVFAFWHRTTDNQWSTCIINQHGVHLIHDGIVMSTLHQVHWACRHIITEVVKAKLVVRAKRNITRIRTATLIRVGFMLVNTIYGQTVEHIERPHPLRVTFGKVVVHGHHVHTFVRQSVEEDRQCSHQRLTFTRGHLGNLTLMQYHAAYQLHVIVHHIPNHFVAACSPRVVIDGFIAVYFYKIKTCVGCQIAVHLRSSHYHGFVLSEATSSTFHHSESIRQNIHQFFVINIQHLFFKVINLVVYSFAAINFQRFYACFQLCDTCLVLCHSILQTLHQRSTASTQLIITQSINLSIYSLDLLHIWHHSTHILLRFVAKQFGNYFYKSHFFSL